jgi:peptidase M1-like protein
VFERFAVVIALLILGVTAVPAQQPARAAEPPASGSVALAPGRSPRNASYAITVRLDPGSRTLNGDELLTWRNTSRRATDTLRFHLYYNAWRNSRSTWMRERADRNSAFVQRPEGDWAWTDITSLRVIQRGGPPADIIARARFIAPDDGNPDDRTVLEVPLDRPAAPGETVNVQIAWSARVPRTFARTGVIGDFYFIAQWFPKIGVLEDAGWNTHQFHSATEFFADFGTYDVRLTVPKGWTVGATGVELDTRDEPDGTTTHHFVQDDVHDFAWTTSPHFMERHARFDSPGLPGVDIRLLLQPEHAGQADRHFAAARATLENYGRWFGPYPYGHLTIVDPAWQSNTTGMEYPTLITAGSRWLAPAGGNVPDSVVVHETGHQFWYGVVATNEFEHAFMDEGFNTYSTARVLEQAFRPAYYTKRYFGDFIPWVFRDFPLSRAADGDRMTVYRPNATADSQATPTWREYPATAGAISYGKTALWLHTLERMVGWPVQQRILSTYFAHWAFRHPAPEDFFAVVNEVTGRDYTWFFDQVYRGSGVFDYAVDSFRSVPNVARGYFGEGAARTFAASEGRSSDYVTTVVVRRRGDGIFPVDVRVVLDNHEEVRWHWDGRDRWRAFNVVKPSRASFAQVDPDHVLLLDVNYTNNSASLAPRADPAARKWSLVWLVWLQDHLLTYGFFA